MRNRLCLIVKGLYLVMDGENKKPEVVSGTNSRMSARKFSFSKFSFRKSVKALFAVIIVLIFIIGSFYLGRKTAPKIATNASNSSTTSIPESAVKKELERLNTKPKSIEDINKSVLEEYKQKAAAATTDIDRFGYYSQAAFTANSVKSSEAKSLAEQALKYTPTDKDYVQKYGTTIEALKKITSGQ